MLALRLGEPEAGSDARRVGRNRLDLAAVMDGADRPLPRSDPGQRTPHYLRGRNRFRWRRARRTAGTRTPAQPPCPGTARVWTACWRTAVRRAARSVAARPPGGSCRIRVASCYPDFSAQSPMMGQRAPGPGRASWWRCPLRGCRRSGHAGQAAGEREIAGWCQRGHRRRAAPARGGWPERGCGGVVKVTVGEFGDTFVDPMGLQAVPAGISRAARACCRWPGHRVSRAVEGGCGAGAWCR